MRVFDATVLNRIANHPELVPAMGFDSAKGAIDFSALANEPHYFALMHNRDETGGMVFERSGPGLWQMHLLFLPECRGAAARDSAVEMIREMFVCHGAEYLWGAIPLTNIRARRFARMVGGNSHGIGPHAMWGAVEEFRCDRAEWLEKMKTLINKGCQPQ